MKVLIVATVLAYRIFNVKYSYFTKMIMIK